jgi:hypothetical protein
MKGQEEIKMNYKMNQTTTNNESSLQADALTDLPVTDEQADRARGGAKGGFDSQGRLLIGSEGGIW